MLIASIFQLLTDFSTVRVLCTVRRNLNLFVVCWATRKLKRCIKTLNY